MPQNDFENLASNMYYFLRVLQSCFHKKPYYYSPLRRDSPNEMCLLGKIGWFLGKVRCSRIWIVDDNEAKIISLVI